MQTHVYANNREIACKAAGQDGVSPQAFPDPCWSPPGPPAGPVVIPYPNTCFADSLTNGTSTVSICGKEVAIEDQSYFGTSTGNEPATNAFGKGVATGVITGKAYFTQWSFDVVFEGFGVPRHTDLVSHNHGSVPGNTPLFPYLSRGVFSFPCKDEEEKIKRECGPEKDQPAGRKKTKLQQVLPGKRSGTKGPGKRDSSDWHWTDDHCDGLELPLPSAASAKQYAQTVKDTFKDVTDELNAVEAVKAELLDLLQTAAGKMAAKLAAKAAAKQAAGSALPVAGNIAMAVWSMYDAYTAIGDVKEIKRVASIALHEVETLKGKLTELQKQAKQFDSLTDQEAHRVAVEAQEALATLNDCVRARKCQLVPHTALTGAPPDTPKSLEPAKKGGGCCHGQTGHHLMPEKSLDGMCPGYRHALAPTVCAEGTTQNFGSHRRVHQALADAHLAMATNGKVDANGTMSMDDALDAATNSHESAFPLAGCSKKCIRAQLESYYKVCGNVRPKMLNASSKPPKPPAPTPPPAPRPNRRRSNNI